MRDINNLFPGPTCGFFVSRVFTVSALDPWTTASFPVGSILCGDEREKKQPRGIRNISVSSDARETYRKISTWTASFV